MPTETKSYKTEATAKAAMTRMELSTEEFTPVLIETQEQAEERGYDSEVVGRYVIESTEDDWTAAEGELMVPGLDDGDEEAEAAVNAQEGEGESEVSVYDQTFKSAGHATAAAKEAGLKAGEYDLKRDDVTQQYRIEQKAQAPAVLTPDFTPPAEEEERVEEEDDTEGLPSREELIKKLESGEIKPVNTLEANRSQSTCEKPVALTHSICAAMYESARANGEPMPRRKDLVAQAEAMGVAKWTARTQVQVWLKRHNQAVQAAMQLAAVQAEAEKVQADLPEEVVEEIIDEEQE